MNDKIDGYDIEKTFNHCFFCGNINIERYKPFDIIGIYSRCPLCGAVAGLDRYTKGKEAGKLYLYWIDQEGAADRIEQDKRLREQALRKKRRDMRFMDDKEILQILKERPEIIRLLKTYDEIPEKKKPEAYHLIMTMLGKESL